MDTAAVSAPHLTLDFTQMSAAHRRTYSGIAEQILQFAADSFQELPQTRHGIVVCQESSGSSSVQTRFDFRKDDPAVHDVRIGTHCLRRESLCSFIEEFSHEIAHIYFGTGSDYFLESCAVLFSFHALRELHPGNSRGQRRFNALRAALYRQYRENLCLRALLPSIRTAFLAKDWHRVRTYIRYLALYGEPTWYDHLLAVRVASQQSRQWNWNSFVGCAPKIHKSYDYLDPDGCSCESCVRCFARSLGLAPKTELVLARFDTPRPLTGHLLLPSSNGYICPILYHYRERNHIFDYVHSLSPDSIRWERGAWGQ